MSDQDRISLHNNSTISSRQVMKIKKSINQGLLSDLISHYPNSEIFQKNHTTVKLCDSHSKVHELSRS